MPDSLETDPANASAAVQRDLAAGATRYEFFQAVRALAKSGGGEPVGQDFQPRDEAVRFRSHVSLGYPVGQVTRFEPQAAQRDAPRTPPVMDVAFLGLLGPAGVLPRHYTETVIERVRGKDTALRDFLDLFHHRIISLFYRAWEKHRVAPLLENGVSAGDTDSLTKALYSLVALGPAAARDRFEFDDRLFVFYAGAFARYPRCSTSLRRLVEEFLGVATRVEQFVGQWLSLERHDQTRLRASVGLGNGQLGIGTIAGERVWDVQSRFRLRLGPVSYDDFLRLTPLGSALTPLAQLVRSYVGPEFDFDIQPVLLADEAPDCQLGGGGPAAPRLGWNIWLHADPLESDLDDAVFVSEGAPTR